MKQQLLDKAKQLLQPLENQCHIFDADTITKVYDYGEIVPVLLKDIRISSLTDEVILFTKALDTREDYYDIDPLEYFSTEEVSTIVNILETQLNQA